MIDTDTDTETKPTEDTGSVWPPVSHFKAQPHKRAEFGDPALCGSKLAGIEPVDPTWPVCKKCREIAARRSR